MTLIADKLTSLYPAFASMPDEALERMLAGAVVRTVPAGTVLFDEQSPKTIHTTHQHLADELGSVREIVSRLLKSFAEQGAVSIGREEIEIVDPALLRRVAQGA